MKTKIITLFLFIISLFYLVSAYSSNNKSAEILSVSAAASLEEPLRKISSLFADEHPQIKIEFNFAGSKGIEQQILKGAPADLFISASGDSVPYLIENGLTEQSKTKLLLKNSLILAAPLNSKLEKIVDLKNENVKSIGMGEPNSAPAGNYAKEALDNLDLWEEFSSKIVYTQNVRQVLSLIETGNIDGGFIYQTDLQIAKNVKKICDVPPETYSNVIYPAILLYNKDNDKEKIAETFYNYLSTEKATKIFLDFGFSLP